MFPPFFSKPYNAATISLSLLVFFFVAYRSPHALPASPARSSVSSSAEARRLFLSLSAGANASIASHLRAITLRPHLAGTPSSAADYVIRHLRLAGLETRTADYRPLLSYPRSSSLALLSRDGTLLRNLSLSEPAAAAGACLVPPYHAYSPSGDAIAAPVYVNYGREEDYEQLRRLGVSVRGCIAIIRKGHGYRGALVEAAAERGAVAAFVFGAPAGGVERGTVLLGGPGDPLTPGWGASASAFRLDQNDAEVRRRFPRIPSMPVSTGTAAAILNLLGGPPAPLDWTEGLPLIVGGVGPGPVLANFSYREDRKLATIRNVFGILRGHDEPDRYVILGNHRDAWTYGAVDPNSGTVALLHVAYRYGSLLRAGWRPRRSIILCSWDGEEFGMIGSTEWVEQNLRLLKFQTVAYINVDCAVQGHGFFADATPQLDEVLVEVTKQVKDSDVEGMTIHETWVAANGGIRIERLARADSDFSPFLHHAGVPSIDLYFGKEFPVYHTAYDSYDWMVKHGDPLFHRHVAVAEIWGLLGIHLADDPILPFSYISYATQLQEHTRALSAFLNGSNALDIISTSVNELVAVSRDVQAEAKKILEDHADGFADRRIQAFNDRLMLAERGFLDEEGLRGRNWFKHLVYSPPKLSDSNFSCFASIGDAILRTSRMPGKSRAKVIRREIFSVSRAIQRAASILRGGLV